MDYRKEAPAVIRDFLVYHETIKGQSRATVDSYYLDLRTFSRYLKLSRGLVPRDTALDDITIDELELDFFASVTLSEVYDFMAYLSRDRGLSAASRARMIISIKGLYNYLTVKTRQLATSPVQDMDTPKLKKALPRYLTLEQSQRLLTAANGKNKERDYCILCLFLNCGLRISEMVGMNLTDIHSDHILVRGKGSKERVVYLNDSCCEAINNWLIVRRSITAIDKNAMFLSTRRKRMSVDAVQYMVKKTLAKAGLDASAYSTHKLRHTAATLMLQNGVDVRTLQEVLGHESLNTTQIYTHIEDTELRTAALANPLAHFDPEKRKTEE